MEQTADVEAFRELRYAFPVGGGSSLAVMLPELWRDIA
jgi:hypothetical protein